MTRDWKYIAYIVFLVLILALVFLNQQRQYDWSLTLSHTDKNPYGTYVLNQLLPNLFEGKNISNSYKTIYELKESISYNDNIIVIASRFNPDPEDTKTILKLVDQGASFFISANYFVGSFADTMGLKNGDTFFEGENSFNKKDSTSIHFVNQHLNDKNKLRAVSGNLSNYFQRIDSVNSTVIARNDLDQAVTVRIKKGKGEMILNCTPMIFTNIYLLAAENSEFISSTLSILPIENVIRTEYYHLGRMEAATPLRFILTNEPLSWAYYITIISLLLFMIFEAKRKQRIIPVIKPLTNSSLEFVVTIGNLYYQHSDHKNIAEKKIQFFFENIHSNFLMQSSIRDENFILTLARKSGVGENMVRELTNSINSILSKNAISKEELIHLNDCLEKFHSKN